MAYTAPTVRATGDLITAAIYNADIINDIKYLHGDDGTVTIGPLNNSGFVVSSSGASVLRIDTTEAAAGNRNWAIRNRYTAVGLLEFVVSAAQGGDPNSGTVAMTLDSGGVVRTGAALMRLHRHPFSNDRHLESGKVAYTTDGSGVQTGLSVTFTDAFSAAPAVTAICEQTGGNLVTPLITAHSTTGATFKAQGAVSVGGNIHWHAEGAD